MLKDRKSCRLVGIFKVARPDSFGLQQVLARQTHFYESASEVITQGHLNSSEVTKPKSEMSKPTGKNS